jgi:hypothetical protein
MAKIKALGNRFFAGWILQLLLPSKNYFSSLRLKKHHLTPTVASKKAL